MLYVYFIWVYLMSITTVLVYYFHYHYYYQSISHSRSTLFQTFSRHLLNTLQAHSTQDPLAKMSVYYFSCGWNSKFVLYSAPNWVKVGACVEFCYSFVLKKRCFACFGPWLLPVFICIILFFNTFLNFVECCRCRCSKFLHASINSQQTGRERPAV